LQEITIVNRYTPNVDIHNFIKQALLDFQAQIDLNTIYGKTSILYCHKYIGHPDKKKSIKKLQN
jgi:hypothetical protein